MRLALALAAVTALALAVPLQLRDEKSAAAVLPLVAGAKDYPGLISNVNTFFANLGTSDDSDKQNDIKLTAKSIQDQINANMKKVPAEQTASWVNSVLLHLVA